MRKIMTIVGTRPEIIKMCRVINELEYYTNHKLVHTGQNYDYELNQIFFEELDVSKPDFFLDAAGTNAASTIANVIFKVDELLEQEKPDAVVLYGDTNSCLAVIAAKRKKIPIFHLEAGNRCFDQRVPEELNRKIVDHLSDINFVLTEHARRYLIQEGIRPETIFKSGSNMPEVIACYEEKIHSSQILNTLGLEKDGFFLISAHREENIDSDENLNNLLKTLNKLSESYKIPIIVSTHPRTRNKIEQISHLKISERIRFLKPFGFFDYMKLQISSRCVVSDSGTITEESSILNFPAVMIRNAHERPEGMDVGTVIMSGLSPERVTEAVEVTINQRKKGTFIDPTVTDYQNLQASAHIVRVILSYIDYVNRTTWKKM